MSNSAPSSALCSVTWRVGGKIESWCIKSAGHDGPHYDRQTGAWWIESASQNAKDGR